MSSPQTHIIQSAVSFGALYPVLGWEAAYFAAPIVLIDVDHILEFYIDTGSLDPRGFFKYYNILDRNINGHWLGLNIFHTLEFYALLVTAGFWHHGFLWALGGCLFHHLFDQISLARRGLPFIRVFSFVEYILRRRDKTKILNMRRFLDRGPFANLTDDDRTYIQKWFGQGNPLPH
ncbi:MAG: hypothetical protein AB7F86_17965 [Bdellovibrionales bacterium]